MAGRRAHVDQTKFDEFLQSIPDEARSQGFWRIKREYTSENGGGVMHAYVGYLQFSPAEAYDSLRERVKNEIAAHRGPGTYYAIPCDDRKTEIKNVDMVKLVFKETEVSMPAPEQKQESPLKETLDSVKKAHKDIAEMSALKLQEKLLKDMLKPDKDEEEEEEVKETAAGMGSGIENLLLYRTLFQDDKKEKDGGVSSQVLKEIFDSKLDAKISELKASLQPKNDDKVERLLEKLVEAQSKPRDDDRFEKLLEKMSEQERSQKTENAFQSMMAMMMQQQQARDKEREAEERRRQDERGEERRRLDEERKLERERLETEERRRQEERKEERTRIEEQMKLEREKFQTEITEQRRRFDEDARFRREELKLESEKSRQYSTEQQNFQIKLLEIMRSSKDSSLDISTKLVDTLVGAGLSSMKTAHEAATAIMDIAKQVDHSEKKEEGGFGSILKDLAQIAGPILAPYASADAQMKMLQSVGQVAGAGGLDGLLKSLMQGGGRPPNMPAMPPMPRPQPQPHHEEASAAGPSPAPKASVKEGGTGVLITNFLQKFPDIRLALVGNLRRKKGVDKFLPLITDMNQPALEALIINMDVSDLMGAIKKACTPEEGRLIDENVAWFDELQKALEEVMDEEDEEEENEELMDQAVKDVVKKAPPENGGAPADAPKPAPSAPAPASEAPKE